MENAINQNFLSIENMLTLLGIAVTITISIIAAIYAIITNTKKYELTENYRCEILSWYKSVIETMIKIIHYCDSGEFYMEEFLSNKTQLLSKLSSLKK